MGNELEQCLKYLQTPENEHALVSNKSQTTAQKTNRKAYILEFQKGMQYVVAEEMNRPVKMNG